MYAIRSYYEPGANLPLQSATINADLEANFTIATRENFGLVLEDATGRIYARSNGRSLTSEEVSEAIEYSVHTLPQYFNLETIEAFLPEVPFTESGLEVAELEVSLQNGFVRASGLAYYRTALLSFTITFSYDFSLSRVTRPYWLNDTTDAIVQVDTRITSYNVCYTKLLRLSSSQMVTSIATCSVSITIPSIVGCAFCPTTATEALIVSDISDCIRSRNFV